MILIVKEKDNKPPSLLSFFASQAIIVAGGANHPSIGKGPQDQYTAHRVEGGMCLGNSLDVLHKSPQSLLSLHLSDFVNNMWQLATYYQIHHISP